MPAWDCIAPLIKTWAATVPARGQSDNALVIEEFGGTSAIYTVQRSHHSSHRANFPYHCVNNPSHRAPHPSHRVVYYKEQEHTELHRIQRQRR